MRIRIKRLSGFKIHLIIALVLLYVGLMGFMGISHAVDVPENTPLSGRELFIKNRCANCHTIGRGRFVGPDLKGVESRYSRDQIEEWMENPE
ncbi:MAG TPA: cytochrome c, partial [Thermodesulfobacteriota bacterium]|nr:cytochrome c [Thermodesulfobacteriota bacterium]